MIILAEVHAVVAALLPRSLRRVRTGVGRAVMATPKPARAILSNGGVSAATGSLLAAMGMQGAAAVALTGANLGGTAKRAPYENL